MAWSVLYYRQKNDGGFEKPIEVASEFEDYYDAVDFAKASEEENPGYYKVERG